jgi:hypothetical protein
MFVSQVWFWHGDEQKNLSRRERKPIRQVNSQPLYRLIYTGSYNQFQCAEDKLETYTSWWNYTYTDPLTRTHASDTGLSSLWYLLQYRCRTHKNERLRSLWQAFEHFPIDQLYFIYHDDGALNWGSKWNDWQGAMQRWTQIAKCTKNRSRSSKNMPNLKRPIKAGR